MVFIVTNVDYNKKRDRLLSNTMGPIIAKCFEKDPSNTIVSVNSGANTKI